MHLPDANELRQRFASCTDCRASLIQRVSDIVAERDRTRLSGLLLDVLKDNFALERVGLYRYVVHKNTRFVIELACFDGQATRVHDAYLVSAGRGTLLDAHSLMRRCVDDQQGVFLDEGARWSGVFPLWRHDKIHLMVEVESRVALGQELRALLERLLDIFNAHLALIDYAETDTLTGLLNRKTFDEHLDRVLATIATVMDDSGGRRLGAGEHASSWLAIIDIDHFKSINDTHGHLIGDEVLLLLAQLMKDSFRIEDQLFRIGGEEFVAVLQATGSIDCQAVLERFRWRVETHVFPLIGKLTISIGFTEVCYFDNPTDLIDRADKALYFAKQHGRNRVDNYERLLADGMLDAAHVVSKPGVELF